jgi:uncharacterized Zn finger protein
MSLEKFLKELKNELVKKFEEHLDGSECPNCKELSLKVVIDFVGDHLDGEAECTACGKIMPIDIETTAPQAMKEIKKALSELERSFKNFRFGK